MNEKAKYINEYLGFLVFDESFDGPLILKRYSKKQIKEYCMDDLIVDGKYWSERLKSIVSELELDFEKKTKE